MHAASPQSDMGFIPRLAIIDDAEFDQMLYGRLIRRAGNVGETLSFLSAEEAIAYFENPSSLPVDVILLDINMPGMSGFDFLDHVGKSKTADFAHVVVVMLTTSLDPSDLARAKTYDLVKDYIHKPLETKHLAKIAEVVATERAQVKEGDNH